MLNWSKEYELRGNDRFPIIIELKREVSSKEYQRWSIERASWMHFQKESKITSKVHDRNTIDEAHSCPVKTILQAAERTIPKASPETKKDHQ